MKYLLILLSFNLFAETKVEIINNEGQPMSQDFETELEADAYIEKFKSKWGRDRSWLREDCGNSLGTRTVQDEFTNEDVIEYDCPATYTATKTDITAQVQAKKDKKDADGATIETIRTKLGDGSAKLDDIIEYLKIKEGL